MQQPCTAGGDAQRALLNALPSCNAGLSPSKAARSPGAIPAMGLSPAHCCTAQLMGNLGVCADKSLKSSTNSFKNTGLELQGKAPSLQYAHMMTLAEAVQQNLQFCIPTLASPSISRFLYIFGCVPAAWDLSVLPEQGTCVSKWI